MLQNIFAVVFIVLFLVELYFLSAASAHKKKKKLKDWNLVTGKIKSIDKIQDEYTHKTFKEITVKMPDGRLVYSRQSPTFCIYDVGEEVELMENEGVHRFLGNDRVNKQSKKETLIGTIPMLILVVLAGLLSFLASIWS